MAATVWTKWSLAEAVSRRSTQLIVLTAVMGAALFARAALGPLQETIRLSLTLTDTQVAILQGPALSIPIVIGAFPLGFIVDRFSRARLLVLLAACTACGVLGSAFAPNFETLLAARSIIGLSAPATWMACTSVLSDLYAPDQRGRANMCIILGQAVGNGFAFILGGALLGLFQTGTDQWRYVLFGQAVPVMLALFLTIFLKEPNRTERFVENPSVVQALRELWAYRRVVVPVLLGISLLGVADGGAITWVAPVFVRTFSMSAGHAGALVGIALLVSGILGPLFGGVIADMCQHSSGPARTAAALAVGALMSVFTAPFASAGSIRIAIVLFVAFMALGVALTVGGTTLLTVIIPNELRGLCAAVISVMYQLLGFAVAPLAVTEVSQRFAGPKSIGIALVVVGTAASLLSALSFLLGRRSIGMSLTSVSHLLSEPSPATRSTGEP